jgi:hypothetical protein
MRFSPPNPKSPARKYKGAWTLMEMMVAVAAGGLLLASVGSVFVFVKRTLDGTANYVELDRQSRVTLDKMTRDIRECGGLTNFDATHLWFTNQDNSQLTYVWDTNAQTLSYTNYSTNVPGSGVLLAHCTYWKATAYTRVPLTNSTMIFVPLPTSNSLAQAALAKVIVMDWICKRTNYTTLTDSESVQTAKVILRN